jgi:hypothetical protein
MKLLFLLFPRSLDQHSPGGHSILQHHPRPQIPAGQDGNASEEYKGISYPKSAYSLQLSKRVTCELNVFTMEQNLYRLIGHLLIMNCIYIHTDYHIF